MQLTHGKSSSFSKASFPEGSRAGLEEYQAGRGVALQPCDWVVPGAQSLLVSLLWVGVEPALFGPHHEEVGVLDSLPQGLIPLPSLDPCLWPFISFPDFGVSLVTC